MAKIGSVDMGIPKRLQLQFMVEVVEITNELVINQDFNGNWERKTDWVMVEFNPDGF